MTEELPRGWTTARLREVTGRLVDGSHNPPKAVDSGRPMLSARNIEEGRIVFDDFRFISDADFDREHARTQVTPGDVLLTVVGALGRAAVVPAIEPFTLQRSVAVLKPRGVTPEFLTAQLQAPVVQAWIQANAKGTAQRGIYLGALGELQLRIPPLNEQRRIVAKLEALQSRSRRAREALDAVPPLLEKLRQSILAAAFRGDLTKDWRAQNPNPEPASALLARIRTERRQKWEASELAKLKAKGKRPTNDSWKAKYEEPEPIDTTGLPELPEGWCWACIDELAFDSLYGPRFGAEQYTADGFPTLRTTDLTDEGEIVWNMPPSVRISEADYISVGLRPNDFVVTRTGATIGKCALYRERDGRAVPSAYLIRFGLVSDSVNAEYTLQAVLSPALQAALRGGATATAQPNVNARTIGRLPLPVAPGPEQARVLDSLAKALGRLSSVRAAHRAVEGRLAAVEQSLLAKAFRGELVPQDPNDEPADAMLARLSAKANAGKGQAPSTKETKKRSGGETGGARAEEA